MTDAKSAAGHDWARGTRFGDVKPNLRPVALRALRTFGVTAQRLPHGYWVHRTFDRDASLDVGQDEPSFDLPPLLLDPTAPRQHPARHHRQVSDYLQRHHLSWITRDLAIDCVIDVGANRGQFGTRLRQAGFRGRIASFEPVSHLLTELRKVTAEDPDWYVHPYALGAESGEVEINVDSRALSSLLPASTFGKEWMPRMAHTKPEWIQLRRLDEMWDQVVDGLSNPRVLLKLDTQGFDLPAFEGAGERAQQIAAVQTEVSSIPIYEGMTPFTQHLQAFLDAGFEVSGMTPVTFANDSLRAIEFDALLVRPELVPTPD